MQQCLSHHFKQNAAHFPRHDLFELIMTRFEIHATMEKVLEIDSKETVSL